MTTLTVTHARVTGAAADPAALVDGPAWDAIHTITGAAPSASIDTTNASNITSGTLAVSAGGTGATTAAAARTALGVTATAIAASGQLPGTATNDNASAGNVGEYISSTIASGSAVALTTGVSANVTSISLTAGDWDVFFDPVFNGTSTTALISIQASVSTTSATLNTTPGNFQVQQANGAPAYNNVTGSVGITLPVGPVRMSLATTTTVFGVAESVFTTSTTNVCGILRARRVR